MRTHDYVEATYRVLQEKTDTATVLDSLRSYLSRRGLVKFYPVILRGLLEKIRRKDKTGAVTVVVARESDLSRQQTEINSALKTIGQDKPQAVLVDETIIGGYVVRDGERIIDQSYKNKLLKAYQRLLD